MITRDKICLYTPTIRGNNTMRTTVLKAAELGVGGVELMNFCDELRTPDMNAARKLYALIKSHGLKIPCFSVSANILADPKSACDNIKAYTDICQMLEIPLLHHTVAVDFTVWDIDDDERNRRFDFCKEYAFELSDYAKSHGVTTIIEDQGFVFNGNQKSIMMSIFLLVLPFYLDKEKNQSKEKKQRPSKKDPR